MHLKPARTATTVAAIGGVLVLGLGSAQAAKANPQNRVACSTDALGSAISGGGTLYLAHNCTYHVRATLTVSTDTTIYGDGATLKGRAPRCNFSIMTVDSAVHVTLNGVNFTDGSTNDDGGAIDDNGDLIVNGGTFSHNSAGMHGGAIDVEAGSLTINGAVFTDNYSVHGGAVHTDGDEITHITDSSFSQNAAMQGGAIFNLSGVDVYGSSFAENTATLGGAIYDNGPARATVDDSAIVQNLAKDHGGGVYYCGGWIRLSGSAVYENVPDDIYKRGSCGD
jgi:predicted outer membrane repeat protein